VLLAALASLWTERRVVVVARSVQEAVNVCESLLSLLHPRETVIDHTKGGSGGGTVNLYLTQNNGALVTPQELARNNEQLVRQIQGGLLRSQQYGGALA
jgi:hypothetical protein